MDIDITAFVANEAPMDYSASVAEIGANAGPDTWRAACEKAAEDPHMLDTDDKREAFRDFVRSSGGWSDDEIAAWSDDELEALFIQWVSGDVREGDISPEMTDADWAEYHARASQGSIAGRIYRADDGTIWFSLDS